MMRTRLVLGVVAATLAISACSGDGATSPAKVSGSNGGTPGDTSHIAPNTVNLSGHVFALQSTTAGQGSDTLRYIPIAGVSLKLMHNVLVNGVGVQELAGTTTSDASGAYRFDGLPGGYYVIYAYPSASSGYDGSYSLVPAQQAAVVVDVYVWKKG